MDQKRSQCLGRLVQYHSVTVTETVLIESEKKLYCSVVLWLMYHVLLASRHAAGVCIECLRRSGQTSENSKQLPASQFMNLANGLKMDL
jgi:hypothetical protein